MNNVPTKEEWQQLQHLEEDLWREETRFDLLHMESLLADDFIEYGRSGRIYQRVDTLAVPSQPIEAVLPLANFHIHMFSKDLAHVTYNSKVTYEGAVQYGRRSSIWARYLGSWVLKFHQGTPYEGDT